MEIITDKAKCEEIYQGKGIMTSKSLKKILNDDFKPDEFMFFREGC